MGNTITGKGDRGLKRTSSLRRSKTKARNMDTRKSKDDSSLITHQHTEGQETKHSGLCVRNLNEKVSQLETDLERLNKITDTRKENIERLVKHLLENAKEKDDESKDEIISRLTNVMKDVASNLMDIQKSSQQIIPELKFSFSTVKHGIRDLEQSGKHTTLRYNHNDKPVFEDLGNIRNRKQKPKEELERPKNQVIKQDQMKKEMQLHEIQPESISTPVQLFYIHESSVIAEMEKELKIMLNRKMGTVNFIHRSNAIDIDQEKLLIIVCIVTTRFGADAARAIKDIRNPENAALLIIHVTEAHCLPKQKSSRHLTDNRFKNLRGIFDMAFKSGNGFFHCDLNENSLNGLSLVCQQPAYGEKL